jgi:hypothetical protein
MGPRTEARANPTAEFRAGSGRTSIRPPLGLPMLGFVRRYETAASYGLPLEVTALALERGATRVILVGVDSALIAAPEVDHLRSRIASDTGAKPEGIIRTTRPREADQRLSTEVLRLSMNSTARPSHTSSSCTRRSSRPPVSPAIGSNPRASSGESETSTRTSIGARRRQRARSRSAGTRTASSISRSPCSRPPA